ncbi:hypothetical protein E6C27_scaffold138G00370 [Cucumis melo var. makuwa]|uniref:Uncharacterized protein n=1 Tax=Cucumis melo var. makuwa TaxID=1194695 RepID=A0A5A7VIF3_CUCMM|nr:hypothetical protein E6C27_scaffold138G00370 [Cucumis melo var. makuwa]
MTLHQLLVTIAVPSELYSSFVQRVAASASPRLLFSLSRASRRNLACSRPLQLIVVVEPSRQPNLFTAPLFDAESASATFNLRLCLVRRQPHITDVKTSDGGPSPTVLLLCSTRTANHRPSLPWKCSVGRRASCINEGNRASLLCRRRRELLPCGNQIDSKNWNKTWNYLSSLEGVGELTLEFSGFTAGLIGDSSPLLGWIRWAWTRSRSIAKFQVRVWRGADRRGARRMREGHMDASGFLYASADSKNDSSIGSKKTVFELKIDCWGCEQSENIKNRATSSKGFRSNAENVFLIEGNNDFL